VVSHLAASDQQNDADSNRIKGDEADLLLSEELAKFVHEVQPRACWTFDRIFARSGRP
jgi:hypothetical protein